VFILSHPWLKPSRPSLFHRQFCRLTPLLFIPVDCFRCSVVAWRLPRNNEQPSSFMKLISAKPTHSARKLLPAFTLIELLVVIAIGDKMPDSMDVATPVNMDGPWW
jgi:hypothetical protein